MFSKTNYHIYLNSSGTCTVIITSIDKDVKKKKKIIILFYEALLCSIWILQVMDYHGLKAYASQSRFAFIVNLHQKFSMSKLYTFGIRVHIHYCY